MQTERATDAGARRMLITLLFVGTALNYVDRQVLALLKPTLEVEFGWTDQEFAHLGSVFQLSAAFALLAVGWFVDKFGVRLAYGVAVAVWSAAGMAHAAAANVGQFVVARSVLAVAESVNTPAAVKAAATYLPLTQRSLGLGLVNTAPNIGAILTPLLIPPLALAFGWKSAFVVTGALGFVWLAFWIVGTRRLVPVAVAKKAALDGNWSELLKDHRTWTIVGAKAFTDCVWWFVLFWSPDFLAKTFGLSQGQIGVPTAIIFTLAGLGALSSGFLFPALLRRGMTVNRARKSSMLFYAVLILPIPLAMQAPGAIVAALIIGLALFAHQGFSTNIFGLAADTVPTSRVAGVMAL
ncbi:MFS transporter, partial [Sandarakinorhabdus sp.]|uniref:MFS transporter n=1 Tax=Sandarakinorhabdus sp. TaxID=1916663 RepID=UPI0033413D84